jgi:hypothetical protein
LFGGHVDFCGDGFGGEIVGIDRVVARLVVNSEGVEDAACVGFTHGEQH